MAFMSFYLWHLFLQMGSKSRPHGHILTESHSHHIPIYGVKTILIHSCSSFHMSRRHTHITMYGFQAPPTKNTLSCLYMESKTRPYFLILKQTNEKKQQQLTLDLLSFLYMDSKTHPQGHILTISHSHIPIHHSSSCLFIAAIHLYRHHKDMRT